VSTLLGLGDDLEAGLFVEQQAQAAADDRVVIGQHDANRVRRTLLAGVAVRSYCARLAHARDGIGFGRRRHRNSSGIGQLRALRMHALTNPGGAREFRLGCE
jgi:hypothetical protein